MRTSPRSITTMVAALAAAALAIAIGTAGEIGRQQPPAPAPVALDHVLEVDPTDELAASGLVTTGPDGTEFIDAAAVLALLEQLPIDSRGTPLKYERDQFGPSWADVDHNGCDTRNDMLQRDLVDVSLKPSTNDCVVLEGTLLDPYTGAVIVFVRGQGTSQAVAIDHRYSLAAAWYHGASGWTPDQRLAFANDPANLQAVDGHSNQSKSSRGPGEWLPENAAHLCEFVTRYTFVADKYELSIDSTYYDAIAGVLAGCGST